MKSFVVNIAICIFCITLGAVGVKYVTATRDIQIRRQIELEKELLPVNEKWIEAYGTGWESTQTYTLTSLRFFVIELEKRVKALEDVNTVPVP